MIDERSFYLDAYRTMDTIRQFERRAVKLFMEGQVQGTVHSYVGQEAVATGVCRALDASDWITSTHRGHGHCLAKGADPGRMMAELMARETGYCRGRGGSMHIADVELGILGANGIVGAGIPIAAGAAWSAQLRGTRQVAVAFFGDGALNSGAFHEGVNLASIWSLPVVFVCENNQYALSSPVSRMVHLERLSERARAYGIPGVEVDGNDVGEVYRAAALAVDRARRGEGPSLLVASTYRWEGHNVGDPGRYRSREEIDAWKARDPLERCAERLGAGPEELARIRAEVERVIAAAVEFALASPVADAKGVLEDVHA